MKGTRIVTSVQAACSGSTEPEAERPLEAALVAQGREIFRHDTLGDETYRADTRRLHEVMAGGVSPRTARQDGLKVDADALPAAVKQALGADQVDLDDPVTTVTLLKLNGVGSGGSDG